MKKDYSFRCREDWLYLIEQMSRRGGSYPMSRADGGSSYRRRRDSMGRYSREGGYSRNDEMISELREMMEGAPDDRTREEIQRLISKMEQM